MPKYNPNFEKGLERATDIFKPEFRFDSQGRLIMPLPGYSRMALATKPGSKVTGSSFTDEQGNPLFNPDSLQSGALFAGAVINIGDPQGWRVQIAGKDAQYPIIYTDGVTSKFYVDKNGTVYLKGQIIAEEGGIIGGWYISTETIVELYAGSGATRVGLRPGSYPFYAGAEDPTSAKTVCTNAGYFFSESGGFGGTFAAPNVVINSDGLYLDASNYWDNTGIHASHANLANIGVSDHHVKTSHHEVYGLMQFGTEFPLDPEIGQLYYKTDEKIWYRWSGTWDKTTVLGIADLVEKDSSSLNQVANYKLVSDNEKSGASWAYVDLSNTHYFKGKISCDQLLTVSAPDTGVIVDDYGVRGWKGGVLQFGLFNKATGGFGAGDAYFKGAIVASQIRTSDFKTAEAGKRIEINTGEYINEIAVYSADGFYARLGEALVDLDGQVWIHSGAVEEMADDMIYIKFPFPIAASAGVYFGTDHSTILYLGVWGNSGLNLELKDIGHIRAGGNNLYDIGESGAGNKFRHLYLSGKAYVVGLDVGSQKITNVLDPTANQEAATKKYVDDNIGAGALSDLIIDVDKDWNQKEITNLKYIRFNNSYGRIYWGTDLLMDIYATETRWGKNQVPSVDGSFDLGADSFGWHKLELQYGANSYINQGGYTRFKFNADGGVIQVGRSFYPLTDNGYNLGYNTFGWKALYLTGAADSYIYRGSDIHLALEAANLKCHRNYIPNTTNSKTLGDSDHVWDYLYVREICLSGVCRTTWPTGVAFSCSDLNACSLANLGTRPHSQLTNIGASDHHSSTSSGIAITPSSVNTSAGAIFTSGKLSGGHLNINCTSIYNYIAAKLYISGGLDMVSSNIVNVGTVDGVNISVHVANDSAHHTRYANYEAVAAVASSGLNSSAPFYLGSCNPYTNLVSDLGSSSKNWDNLYVSDIYHGGTWLMSFTGATEVQVHNRDFIPSSDNTKTCGRYNQRWSDIRSVLINGADYGFENNWYLTENDRMGIKEKGIAILNPKNELKLFIGETGIYVKGGNVKNLDLLPYVRTTLKQRAKMDAYPELRKRTKDKEGLKLPDVKNAKIGGAKYIENKIILKKNKNLKKKK